MCVQDTHSAITTKIDTCTKHHIENIQDNQDPKFTMGTHGGTKQLQEG